MHSVHEIKRREITETPLLLFECQRASGVVERWSTHGASFEGIRYEARVLRHNLLEFRAGSEDSIDAASRVVLLLANADSRLSQIQRNEGWKGARLTVRFVFWNAIEDSAASETLVLFRGICNPPDEITESTLRLSFTSRMNMQRILLPQVRVQRRCPWMFPSTAGQRAEAAEGGNKGKYSPFHACGYSADTAGGTGSLSASGPFTTCDYTRAQCIERGMFNKDAQDRDTRRFGGIEFVPSTISVKTYGEKNTQLSGAVENESKYNDFVPMVYGTAWYRPPIVFARNDGNLTRMEVLLGLGEIEDVVKVVVNGAELPAGSNASHPTATGWYNIVSRGSRNGSFNLDFTDAAKKPVGDPYGSMAVLSVVVPNRLSDGTPLPRVEVLLRGLRLPVYDETGSPSGETFTNNPAWVILDLLRRTGWDEQDIDFASFARTAAYCGDDIETTDLNGTVQMVPRFQCNLVLRRRRSAADVIRGVRNGSGLYLTYGVGGLLQLHAEGSFALQQSDKSSISNSSEPLNGGWPAYEFGDGASPFSDILRRASGEPAVRVWCRPTAETANRFSLEFQDEFNEYQQDSLSLVDLDDAVLAGHEVSASMTALGVANFNQAARVLRLALDKSIRGNTFIEFETGLRAIGLKPGDLITISYAKEGFERQPFRIIRIAPGANFQTAMITAQWHDDVWYTGGGGALGLAGGGRLPAPESGVPRPLVGIELNPDGSSSFGVAEAYRERADGGYDVDISVRFSAPPRPSMEAPARPVLHLAAGVATTGGSLAGGRSYYYAISAENADGAESALSFVVRAAVPDATASNAVTLNGISLDAATTRMNVYRGPNPSQLLRIASVGPNASFIDMGEEAEPAAPPDEHYHHANFYWRLELMPERACTTHSSTSIGSDGSGMLPNEYGGRIVRITDGSGAGQERVVASNDENAFTLVLAWDVEPDETSRYVVCENGWNFGGVSESGPATFTVPNRQNAVIQISGRAANVNDRECAYELSPLTRHVIGGAAEDADVPDIPIFGMSSAGRGKLEIGAIGFESFENTRSITAASLTLHCWNELSGVSESRLVASLTADEVVVVLTKASGAREGMLVQIGAEVVVIRSLLDAGTIYEVERGAYGTSAADHSEGEVVYHLDRRITVLPFVRGFFGSPASGSYSHAVEAPNLRVVVAEMFVTNIRGKSQTGFVCYAGTEDGGLRTLSGGQINLQIDGPLAVQSGAVPPIQPDTDRAVRDVLATLAEAPQGDDVRVCVTRNGEPYCDLTIPSGDTVSSKVDGRQLTPLRREDRLGLDVLSAGQTAGSTSGASLTVMIRF